MSKITNDELRARQILADYYRRDGNDGMADEVVADNWRDRTTPGEISLVEAITRGITELLASRASETGVSEAYRVKALVEQIFVAATVFHVGWHAEEEALEFIQELAQQALAALALSPAAQGKAEPVRWWEHTLHREEFNKPQLKVTNSPSSPFGIQGRNYDPSFHVTSRPLYTHPSPPSISAGRDEGLERVASAIAALEQRDFGVAPIPYRDGFFVAVSCAYRIVVGEIRSAKGSRE